MRKILFYAISLTMLFILFSPAAHAADQSHEPAPAEFDTEVFFRRVKEAEVPIVMYHLVTQNPKYIGKYGITPAELEDDLKFLHENGYNTVVMQDLINFVNKGKKLPKNPIMLTFDDGNTSDYTILLPLLQKYKMKAVIAVLGAAADKYTVEAEENPSAVYPNLTWKQISELHNSGHVEIANHSYNLHTPPLGSKNKSGESPEAYHARLLADLQKFQHACTVHLGITPTTYVYPLGALGEGSRAVLEELGMVASVSCQEGKNIIRQGDKDCLFLLKRTNRPSGRSIKDILEKIS